MTVKIHNDVEQGSEQWAQLRCGILTASEMKLIVTPTLKIASNDKERAHLYELLAQRVTGYVEPHYYSDDMLRGHVDEVKARLLYSERYAEVTECGFITNDKHGFMLGYSPDGLVGHEGLIEGKSRRQKFQVQTIIESVFDCTVPVDFAIQCQTGLLVAERQWIDFLSYHGGLPMVRIRAFPDPVIQNAVVEIAGAFEQRIAAKLAIFNDMLVDHADDLIPTEREIEQEMIV